VTRDSSDRVLDLNMIHSKPPLLLTTCSINPAKSAYIAHNLQ
jgi:hypothetical protein